MNRQKLKDGLFLYLSPDGAYHAVSDQEYDEPRGFLTRILQLEQTPVLSMQQLLNLSGLENEAAAVQLLLYCEQRGWLQGIDSPLQAPANRLEEFMPDLLAKIAENNPILLADESGANLISSGFSQESAVELAKLSHELAHVHNRRGRFLAKNLGVCSHAWAVVDAHGNSQIGCWPLYIGERRFVLAVSGVPHFNHAEFVTVAWALVARYGKPGSSPIMA